MGLIHLLMDAVVIGHCLPLLLLSRVEWTVVIVVELVWSLCLLDITIEVVAMLTTPHCCQSSGFVVAAPCCCH